MSTIRVSPLNLTIEQIQDLLVLKEKEQKVPYELYENVPNIGDEELDHLIWECAMVASTHVNRKGGRQEFSKIMNIAMRAAELTSTDVEFRITVNITTPDEQ